MTQASARHSPASPVARRPARRWWVLATVVLAQLMITLDSTVVNIALPSAQHALAFSSGDRQWIITAYSMAFGGLLLLGGRVSDLIGRKRAFLAGLIGLAAASAAGGAAGSFAVLVTARVIQGVSGALLAPTALAVLITTFTDLRDRARAFAAFSAASSGGAAVGLLLGGVLTQELSWRWTLYINVFIGVTAAAGAAAFVVRAPRQGPRPGLDIPGAVLDSAGLFALVLGLSEAESSGWGSPQCWAALAAAGVLLAGFAAWQHRAAHPLLPLGVVADRDRGGAFAAMLLVSVGMFGVLLFVNYYLQGTLGYSPVTTGVAFLPMVVVLITAAQLASRIFLPRLGAKTVIPSGMAVAAAGMILLTRLGIHSSYAAGVLPGLLLLGFGIGTIITSSFQTATLGIAPRLTGIASAAVNTSQQIGGSIGTTLLNTIAIAATAGYLSSHPHSPAAAVHGYTVAYWWGAGTYAFGALLTVLLFRRRSGQQQARLPDAPRNRADETFRALPTPPLRPSGFVRLLTRQPSRSRGYP